MLTFKGLLAAASLTLLATGDASANDLGKYKECFLKCWGRVTALPDHCAAECGDVMHASFNDIVINTQKPNHEHCMKYKCFDRSILTNDERLFACLVDGCFASDPNSEKKGMALEVAAPRRTVGNELESQQGKKVRRAVKPTAPASKRRSVSSSQTRSLLRRRSNSS